MPPLWYNLPLLSLIVISAACNVRANDTQMPDHEERITRLERIINEQQREIEGLRSCCSAGTYGKSSSQPVQRSSRQIPEQVAFSAYLDHDLVNVGPGVTLKMHGVQLNDGNGYNNVTGIFTAPTTGVYLITYTIEDFRGHRVWTKLVVDDVLRLSVITWASPGGSNDQSSNTALLRLTKGQSVWVAIDEREQQGAALQGSQDIRATTFSGALLYLTD